METKLVSLTGGDHSKLVKNSTLKVYRGFDDGMCTTYKDTINADLLAFIRS